MNRNFKLLEFDKVIAMAAEHAVCECTAEKLTTMKPAQNAYDMRRDMQKTDAVVVMCQAQSMPSLFTLSDNIPDIVKRAKLQGVLSMAELLYICSCLKNGDRLNRFRDSCESFPEILEEDFFFVYANRDFASELEMCILSETEMSDGASAELKRIRREIQNTESSIKDKLEKTIKGGDTGKFLQDTVITMRNNRYVVPVKSEHRSEFGGVIHDVSSSGSTVFIEPAAVVEANAKILRLKSEEQDEILRILTAFSVRVASLADRIVNGYNAIIDIEVLLCKARLAITQNAVMPTFSDKAQLSFIKARHPLIPKQEVVPIDVHVGQEFNTLVITGPNTGGKTVTLKTVGLLLAMAKHGFLLPVLEKSTVGYFEDIFVDIGDEQSIEQSLSTFSGHVKNLKVILEQASSGCLVLLDELGAGTDPAEGAALATAIIEQLMGRGAVTIATTHYAELKLFALETLGVQNASCEFDVATLRPTYKIIFGVPGRSNAFLIGQRLGLSAELIASASQHLTAESKRFEDVLSQLDELKQQLRDGSDEVERLKAQAQEELERAKEQRKKAQSDADSIINSAQQKAKNTLSAVEKEAYDITMQLRAVQKQSVLSMAEKNAKVRELQRRSEQAASGISSGTVDSTHAPIKDCNVGDEVYIVDLKRNGSIFSVDKKKKTAVVVAGNFKSTLAFSRLAEAKKSENIKKTRPRTKHNVQSRADRQVRTELMLLGKNVDEACMEADNFIDGAVLSGLKIVYLVHGKGTGVLRKGLHAHLKTHRSVKKYRLGLYGEGEDGVTVVELK